MSREQKFVLAWMIALVAVLALLALLRKRFPGTVFQPGAAPQPAESVTHKIFDINTGVEIGPAGVRNSAIGPALPPSMTEGPLAKWNCPAGAHAVIDPDNAQIYCVLDDSSQISA